MRYALATAVVLLSRPGPPGPPWPWPGFAWPPTPKPWPASRYASRPFLRGVNTGCDSLSGGAGADVGKDDRRLYICPECNGSQMVVRWKRADVGEEQEIATTELCPTCDGSGQILGPST
jgi:hypothetical protein